MALYLGIDKVKLNLDNVVYNLNLFSETPIVTGVMLLSVDNNIIKDSNGLYITTKEDE